MHFLAAFRELPISLIITSFALISKAIPVHSTELTPDNFKESTATGLWFIEYFSPYCGHCRQFAPTWQQLVEESEQSTPSVKLAQVNCAVYGDLCNEKGVTGYPTMRMYNAGKDLEKYTGDRSLPDLHAFIKRHADSVTPKAPPPEKAIAPNLNWRGPLAKGPMFVKFFAPWCGHCKKLAPVKNWLVAEVDCDDNGALCKANNIHGYPTLVYMTSGGLRSEYNGGRKLEQLKAFGDKASSAGIQPIKTEELDGLVKENDILYLLIHSASDANIIETIQRAATPLLGSPSLFTSSDPDLLTRFSVPQTSTWALVALKDHDGTTAASILPERTATSEEKIKTWLLSHRLSTTVELTQDTFQNVMNAPQAPLVVITAFGPAMREKVRDRLVEVGQKWRARTKGTGMAAGREVVFAYMDAERWRDWMKSMYGVVGAGTETELEDLKVVITDHKRLVYFDKDTTDSRIKITTSANLFATVEAAASGALPYKNSENRIERLARYLNHKMLSLETYVVTYPWRTAFCVFMVFVAVFMGIKRLISDDVPADYRKVDRLD
ncbi:protein disulfide isomerase [Lyophyllum atratum]|nr:protein disulfide isomerase [Lyophyllum atratum]